MIAGPAVIEQEDTTTLLPPGWTHVLCAGRRCFSKDAHPMTRADRFDPITLEVIRNRLDVVAEEMQSTLLRARARQL